MKTLLLVASFLLVMTRSGSAGEVLYYLDGSQWRAAGGYQDPADCAQAAIALAKKLNTKAGCAPPSPAIQYNPDAVGDMDRDSMQKRATRQWEDNAAQCAKKSRLQITTDGQGSGQTLGTDAQRFAFDKCMNERSKAAR